jgi:hypothetical protein
MKVLIIGAGQVGTGLKEVLSSHHDVVIRDIHDMHVDDVDVLHICYPYHEGFEENTRKYVRQYEPGLVIINSSVPVGTTTRCGHEFVYSPVRGRHPKLAQEMKRFVAFVGGKSQSRIISAANYLQESGWNVLIADSSESLEFFKVLSNVHMGLEIAWRQEAERLMRQIGISSKDYHAWERTYRDGCIDVGDLNLVRPIMKADPIGGHCILSCTEMLRSQVKSPLLDFIIESNEKAKDECFVS